MENHELGYVVLPQYASKCELTPADMSKPTENEDTQPVVTYATFPRCECPSNCSCPCARNFRQLFHRMREWKQSTENEIDNLQRELEQERGRRRELEAQVRNMEGFRHKVQEETRQEFERAMRKMEQEIENLKKRIHEKDATTAELKTELQALRNAIHLTVDNSHC